MQQLGGFLGTKLEELIDLLTRIPEDGRTQSELAKRFETLAQDPDIQANLACHAPRLKRKVEIKLAAIRRAEEERPR